MTSFSHTVGQRARIKHDVMFRWSSPGGGTSWTSRQRPCLVEFIRLRHRGEVDHLRLTGCCCCCNVKSEVDALRQLCLRAGVGQKAINTCSPNKSNEPFSYLLTYLLTYLLIYLFTYLAILVHLLSFFSRRNWSHSYDEMWIILVHLAFNFVFRIFQIYQIKFIKNKRTFRPLTL